MSKRFWTIIVSLWLALLISGFAAYKYIEHLHQNERQELIFNYVYAEDDKKENQAQENYPIVQYESDVLIEKLSSMYNHLTADEEALSASLSISDAEKKEAALARTIEAYQRAKDYVPLFANIEITNASLLQKKQLEKLSTAAYNYSEASATYFIICANYLKSKKRDNIEQDYKIVQENLKTTKDAFSNYLHTYTNE